MPARAIGSRLLIAAGALALLAGCEDGRPEPQPRATEVPEEIASEPAPEIIETTSVGTPMAERVATIGLINKRNNITRDIEMTPGDLVRLDDVIIRMSACERTAPWEAPAQTGAFVQLFVNERRGADADTQWYRVFSGWLFKENPSINVVEHPIYDVWVKDCAMSFPDEEGEG